MDAAYAQLTGDLQQNLELVLNENNALVKKTDISQLVPFVDCIRQANRIFIIAAGRSGFAMQSAAMRLMHLGLTVYVVGETTTPAIQAGDILITASGSGTTSSVVRAAEKSVAAGAKVLVFSTNNTSPLARLAAHVMVIPAAGKQEHNSELSRQYAGSLFEQFLLLLTDALFQSLWKLDGTPAEALWKRHANLE